MKNHFDYSRKSNLIIQHSFNLVFKKIETLFFSFLCVFFLVVSKTNQDLARNISFAFVNISTPISSAAAFPFNSTIDLFTNFGELVRAKKENVILKKELEKFKESYITVLNINEENKELRNTLNFVKSRTTTYQVASVIGISNQAFNQKLFIDAGLNRGVKEGQIITGKQGVIGRIAEVDKEKSRLFLLSDIGSKIPIISSATRLRGILAGNNSSLMEILYLPKNHKIEIGEKIFTSGDGDTMPPGLLVGIVKKVDANSVSVAMVEDMSSINFVSIIEF